jgi:putative endonuclease
MTRTTLATGRRGERLAAEYFDSIGARLLERNFHVQYAEVDLIYEHEGDLVAVEVKTRSVLDLAAPEECVFPAQLRRIFRGLATYAQDNELDEMPFRIDVIAIVLAPDGEVLRLDHLKSVYPL